MSIWRDIPRWLGITSPRWLHEAMARRNMLVIALGAAVVALFAGMLSFFLVTGLPSPIDNFDAAAYETPAITFRYRVTAVVVLVLMTGISLFALFYTRRKWNRPGVAAVATMLFAFLVAMLWGIAVSGHTADRQLLIFASIQFLVAGVLIFDPIVSLVYFASTFCVFGVALDLSGMINDVIVKDLIYLGVLDVVVCWASYGLFARATGRERAVVNLSQRDELTGAKNRHCLRDDFVTYIGSKVFVMFCDIDNFKRYNDEYDHSVGDELLKQFYFALREVFGDECVYRYGGDEFLVMSVEFGDAEFKKKLGRVADQLVWASVDDIPMNLTYSGGYIQGLAVDGDAIREMLHTADENLLEAKHSGKNKVVGSFGESAE